MNRFFLLITLLFFASGSFSQTYEELVSKSLDYIDSKEYVAAEETLKQAMRKEPANPGNILLLSNLGTVQRELGKTEEALISYSSALSKYPENVVFLHNRASLLCEIDSLDAAMRDYNVILSLDENNVEALYRRGLIYMSEKNSLLAEADFEKVLEIRPNYLPAHNSLIYTIKARQDWEEAENKYTDLIYKYKDVPEFYIGRAECYLNLKKLARAKEDLNKALELKKDDPMLYIIRGQLNLQQFDKFMAKEDFQKAKDLGADPQIIDEYMNLCK
ncbi:MAG TPA: hypothetical protein DIT04_07520 [Dysgonomonas sp.]|nr:hypothetical protein [Dysgonomonas sp.]